MFQRYIKLTWRNFFRNKTFSVINLLGLTSGITCAIFIFLWVEDELTYDRFHKNYDNIYQVMANRNFENGTFTDQYMVFPLAFELGKSNPQIKKAVLTSGAERHVLSLNDTKLTLSGYMVSSDYFGMFTWKFLRGNPRSAISDPSSIVISESTAHSFFGNADAIGKILRLDNYVNLKISAVVKDPPGNSSLIFDFIRPVNLNDADGKIAMTEWVNSSWLVYVETIPGANLSRIGKQISDIMHQRTDAHRVSDFFIFPMKKWRLYSEFKDGHNVGGMISYVRLFIIVAIIILLIACVNFINLSTARSEKRSKEVGIRKTLGSARAPLIVQFFMESLSLTFTAFIFSLLFVFLLMPFFNSLIGKHLSFDISDPVFWTGAIIILVFTGLVAGSYPALYLSSFNPVKVLKGARLFNAGAGLPRKILVTGQFVVSVLLISATIIVYQQLKHISNRDRGYDYNNLIMIPGSPKLHDNYASVKQDLITKAGVSAVTRTSAPVTDIWWLQPSPDYEGKPPGSTAIFSGMFADADFIKTMNVKLLSGRNFSRTPADSSSVILNKTAVKTLGLKNPIGMQLRTRRPYTVIGVLDDMIMGSPYKAVDPMMIYSGDFFTNYLTLRLSPGVSPKSALPEIEKIIARVSPEFPFEYQFADQEFDKKLRSEQLISKLTNIFAGLAIFICCMGLVGLASYTIEKRVREISVRKVLGATVKQLLLLLSKEFLQLAIIALIIAIPLTWWLMDMWLKDYTFHIQINGLLFLLVGAGTLLVTLVVVSLTTTRAAMSNPVINLKRE
jgi:putative ABC transport system permease protein